MDGLDWQAAMTMLHRRIDAVTILDDMLLIRVRDDGRGPPPSSPSTERIGLGNTRRRVEHLYPNAGALEAVAPADGGFEVSIRLPLRGEGGDADPDAGFAPGDDGP